MVPDRLGVDEMHTVTVGEMLGERRAVKEYVGEREGERDVDVHPETVIVTDEEGLPEAENAPEGEKLDDTETRGDDETDSVRDSVPETLCVSVTDSVTDREGEREDVGHAEGESDTVKLSVFVALTDVDFMPVGEVDVDPETVML